MRHHGGSEQPVKGRRANGLKGRKVSTAVPSMADLQEQVGALTRELKEAREQQTATADVLKVMSGSAFELGPVFQAVVSAAVRLCRADMATIYRNENGEYRWAADHSIASPDYARVERNVRIRPGTGTLVGRVALNRDTVQILILLIVGSFFDRVFRCIAQAGSAARRLCRHRLCLFQIGPLVRTQSSFLH
jgi:two-component system NtrC family sensor kinase